MVPEYLKFLVGTRYPGSQDLLAITSLSAGRERDHLRAREGALWR